MRTLLHACGGDDSDHDVDQDCDGIDCRTVRRWNGYPPPMTPWISRFVTLGAALALAACAPGASTTPMAPDGRAVDTSADVDTGDGTGGADASAADSGDDSAADTDSGLPCKHPQTWYEDVDGDGWGDRAAEVESCDDLEGYSRSGGDCAPTDPTIHPNATELCNGIDDDCDSVVAGDEADGVCDGGCDLDTPPALTAVVETCDGLDNNGDGTVDENCLVCTRNVPADHATIQEAIDAAATGDVVCVAPGTYEEFLDFGGAEIAVIGAQGASVTTIDGDGKHPVVRFGSGEPASTLLAGFTLTGGQDLNGGGIQVIDASPTIQDVVVTKNTAYHWQVAGAGIYVSNGAPTFQTVVVSENHATYTYCVSDYGDGGGVALSHDESTLDNVWIVDNVAEQRGGGIVLEESEASLVHVRIERNDADSDVGGGMLVLGGAPRFTNVVVRGNTASAMDEVGGAGIHVMDGDVQLTNVVVACNELSTTTSDPGGGGGICVEGGSVALIDSIVTSNTSVIGGGVLVAGGTVSTTRSDLWANVPANVSGMADPTGIDGNLSVDPAFERSSYHLSAASPLIDAGDPAAVDPDGSPADLGAFGGPAAGAWDLDGDHNASWWLPGPYDPLTSPGLDCDDGDPLISARSGC